MATETIETYLSVDGVMTKQSSETVTVDIDAEITSKEDQLLEVAAELEALKAQRDSE